MATLYMMCGVPGSGKTTFAKRHLSTCRYISRDEIRYSILKEDEEYFSHETEVFEVFIREIAMSLAAGQDTIADATHINPRSRQKTVNALNAYGISYTIVFVCMGTPYAECKKRNGMREGRTCVPEGNLFDMYTNFEYPRTAERECGYCEGVWMIN